MNKESMVQAFNEWMRKYIEEPNEFKAEFQTVIEFQRANANGEEPTYGDNCTAYLHKLDEELTKANLKRLDGELEQDISEAQAQAKRDVAAEAAKKRLAESGQPRPRGRYNEESPSG